MSKSKKSLRLVLCQEWIEYERGWGCRPDGCSLHLSENDRKSFCAAYWERMPPRGPGGRAPDEYSAESNDPYIAIVSNELYARVSSGAEKFGIWVVQSEMRNGEVRRATPDELLIGSFINAT